MKISQSVIEVWPAQNFITMGDNPRTQSVRVVFLVCDTPTQCPLPNGEVSWKYLEGVMGRTRFNLTTMGGNSKTESARVVFLVRDTPTQCPLHIGEVSWKYLKGFQSYGPHKFFCNFGRLWEITPEPSRLELLFLHATLLPNALYNLSKFHESSSKGIGVMGRKRF